MRFLPIALLLSCALPAASGQAVPQSSSVSDAQAISLAQKSIAALTGGTSISDVTLNANVISIFGSDYETGTGILRAKGASESRVDLNLSGGTLAEVRNLHNNTPAGAWSRNAAVAVPQASHNVLTDASWFYPGLSCLSDYGSVNYVLKYLGLTQRGGVNAQHIQISLIPSPVASSLQRLSVMDFYLDQVSFLPLAVDFKIHPDTDVNTDIPVEILFANYRAVNGVQIPFHIQKMLNGGIVLDMNVTSAVVNSGLADTPFFLQ